MNHYSAFSVTVTGGTHIKQGKVCQDISFHYPPYCAKKKSLVSLALIADGHGSEDCFRSVKGAQIAVKCASALVAGFVKSMHSRFNARLPLFPKPQPPPGDEFEKSLHGLIKHIVARWQITVEEDYTQNPFTPEELANTDEKRRKEYEGGKGLYKAYGTTLIAAAITADYCSVSTSGTAG